MITLKNQKAFRFTPRECEYTYVILRDYESGRRNRYTVLAFYGGNPTVIGRELPFGLAKRIAEDHARKPWGGWIFKV